MVWMDVAVEFGFANLWDVGLQTYCSSRERGQTDVACDFFHVKIFHVFLSDPQQTTVVCSPKCSRNRNCLVNVNSLGRPVITFCLIHNVVRGITMQISKIIDKLIGLLLSK